MDQIGHWSDELIRLRACNEAVQWARGYATFEEAWTACGHGDWMLWYAGRVAGPPWSESRRPLVRAAVACARLTLPVWEAQHPDDRTPHRCLDLADRWARGEEVRQEDLLAAAAAAYDAAAHAAAPAAYAAAYAAAAAYDARKAALAQCADLVRQVYQTPPERTEPC